MSAETSTRPPGPEACRAVADQLIQDPTNAFPIDVDQRQRIRDIPGQPNGLRRSLGFEPRQAVANDGARIDWLPLELDPPGLQPRQIEQVIGEPAQPVHLFPGRGYLALPGRSRRAGRHRVQAIQRGGQTL